MNTNKKTVLPEDVAKKEKVAFKFSKGTKLIKKGEVHLLGNPMAELFKAKKLGEVVEVTESEYNHLVLHGKFLKKAE